MTNCTVPTNLNILAYLSMSIEYRRGVVNDRLRAEVAAADARVEAAVRAALRAAALRIVSFERGTAMHSPPQLLTDAHDQICAIAADPAAVAAIVKGVRHE